MKSEYHKTFYDRSVSVDPLTKMICFNSIDYDECWGYIEDDGRNCKSILHRVDGPALIIAYKDGVRTEAYYLLNCQVSKEDFYTPGLVDAFLLENS